MRCRRCHSQGADALYLHGYDPSFISWLKLRGFVILCARCNGDLHWEYALEKNDAREEGAEEGRVLEATPSPPDGSAFSTGGT